MTPARRIGAVLLLVGGLLEAARLIVFTLVFPLVFPLGSPAWPVLASMAVYSVPSTLIGAGLVAVGLSVRGRGRLALLIAGVLYLAMVVVIDVQVATLSPFGPGPAFLAGGVALAAVVVAAALLLSDRALHGPARWAVAIPAGCIVLLIVGVYARPLGSLHTDVLPGLGFAIAGALLLRRIEPPLSSAEPAP